MTNVAMPFLWVGNLPCLDFVNTEAMAAGERVDLLAGFPGLVGWMVEAGLLADAGARAALERWDGKPEGSAALRQALVLRQALRRIVERVSDARAPAADDLELLNRTLAEQASHPRVVRKAGGYELTRVPERDSALQLLGPIADSAAWLLTSGDPALLRRCENPQCILFFYDTTRNGRRRWCSMAGCGSRAKAAAYYRRQRSGKKRS